MRPIAAKMRDCAEKFMQIVVQDTKSLSVADSKVVYDTILAAFAAGTKNVFAIEREELESAMLDGAKRVPFRAPPAQPVAPPGDCIARTLECGCEWCKSPGRCNCSACKSGATMQTELLMVLDLYAQTHNPTLAQAKMIYDLLLTAYSCGSKRAEPVPAEQLTQWLRESTELITSFVERVRGL